MNCRLRTVFPLDKRRFWLFLLWIFLGGVLSVFSQDTNVEPEAVLVPETQDKVMLEIDAVVAEELKQVSPEWKNSLFTDENVNLIKIKVRKTLPESAAGISEGSRKALIRKFARDSIYGSMKSVVMKGAETLLLEFVEALPPDWREVLLTHQNFGGVFQQALGETGFNFLNLPQKEREAVLKGNLKKEIILLQQSIITTDAEKSLYEAVNKWPEAMRANVDVHRMKAASQILVKSVLQKTTPELPKKEINMIIEKDVSAAVFRLAETLVEAKMMDVIARETGGMGPGLTDALVIDEKTFKGIIAEIKDVIKGAGETPAEKDPVLFYHAASGKVTGIVQKTLIRERDKYRGECLKTAVAEETAFDQKRYWLMAPITETVTKENETYPYVDEYYHICRAVADKDLSHCDKITGEGRQGHKEDCQTFAQLYLKVLPELLEKGAYPAETMNEIFALQTSVNAKKDALEPLLKACKEKNAASCGALKEKDDFLYRVCVSAINRDVKTCSSSEFATACVQSAYALEAFLYNDDSKIKKLPYEQISVSWPLLGKLHFNKNACAEFYTEVIQKRYCYNLYMYKPAKEVKKDEKETKQK